MLVKRLVAVLVVAAALVIIPVGSVAADSCTADTVLISGCSTVTGTVDDEEVVLEGEHTVPGAPGTGPGVFVPSGPVDPLSECIYILNGRCLIEGPARTRPAEPITLADIASFRPVPGVDHMEPNGWVIVGLDANFYATGGASVVDGTLLGFDASVRFTPIRWQWAYGDGATATKSTRGGTWQSLGLAEFDPTPTSHVYDAAGTYFIDLTIGYRAEYTFNGSTWATISGTLWLPANRLVATVGSAKTVLVERDCTVNPAGPGCSG